MTVLAPLFLLGCDVRKVSDIGGRRIHWSQITEGDLPCREQVSGSRGSDVWFQRRKFHVLKHFPDPFLLSLQKKKQINKNSENQGLLMTCSRIQTIQNRSIWLLRVVV